MKKYLFAFLLMGLLTGVVSNSLAQTTVQPQDAKKKEEMKVRNVAIVIFDGVELLDFAGPGEVFAVAKFADGQKAFNAYTVAATTAPIVSQGFVKVTPQYSFDNAPKADIVVFPGGRGIDNFIKSEKSMMLAKTVSGEAEIAMSVCSGAYVLAKAGMLDNKKVTTHWGRIEGLRKMSPSSTVLENVRFVDNGQILTTAGISAGIDGSLHLVERLLGTPSAERVARVMEYNWQPPAKDKSEGK